MVGMFVAIELVSPQWPAPDLCSQILACGSVRCLVFYLQSSMLLVKACHVSALSARSNYVRPFQAPELGRRVTLFVFTLLRSDLPSMRWYHS